MIFIALAGAGYESGFDRKSDGAINDTTRKSSTSQKARSPHPHDPPLVPGARRRKSANDDADEPERTRKAIQSERALDRVYVAGITEQMRQQPEEKCKACEHWFRVGYGHDAQCTKNMQGFPLIGPRCERFSREPGAWGDKEYHGWWAITWRMGE